MTLSSWSHGFKTFWNSCCVKILDSAELRNSQPTLWGALRLARRKSSHNTPDLEDTQPALPKVRHALVELLQVSSLETYYMEQNGMRPVLTVVEIGALVAQYKRKQRSTRYLPPANAVLKVKVANISWNLRKVARAVGIQQLPRGVFMKYSMTAVVKEQHISYKRLKSCRSTHSYSCVCPAWLGSIVFLGWLRDIAGTQSFGAFMIYRNKSKRWTSIHNDAFVLGNQELQRKWMDESELSWHSIVCQPAQSRLGTGKKRVPGKASGGMSHFKWGSAHPCPTWWSNWNRICGPRSPPHS